MDTWKYICCGLALLFCQSIVGQIHYSQAFTDKLNKFQLDFVQPVEGMYKIVLPKKNDIIPLDLKLLI